MEAVLAGIERRARSVAHDVVYRRRGFAGWKAKRDEFLRSARKDAQTLRRDVEKKLRAILTHAFETVPYYREAWKAAGIDPSAFRQLEDLQRFPCVTKVIVREYRSSLVSSLYHENALDADSTSGTTGSHTTFYRDHDCTLGRIGRQWGVLSLCGYRPGMKRALVWGVNADLSTGRANRSLRARFREFACAQEALPCAIMNEGDMTEYHRRLAAFGPEILYGYPNAIEELARFISEKRLQPIHVKSIITTAERLTPAQRALFEQVYGGEVFNLYNTREYGCVGFECRQHDGFHIDTESVFVEVTRDGKRVRPGEIGEITITDLLNRGMPFIRSRTGDLGVISPAPCACGSPLPVLKSLHGRITDVLYRTDGSAVAGILLPDYFVDVPGVKAVQFVQQHINQVDVLLVVEEGYSTRLEQEGLRRFQEIMGSDMEIRLVHVPEIRRNTNSGKLQDVICKVSADDARARRKTIAV